MELIKRRKRGRPANNYGPRLTKRFEPKTWKPLYDHIIYYHCLGKTNIWIAEKFNCSPQTVTNIINCDQGRKLLVTIQAKLRQSMESNISERMLDVADKFMKKIERIADDEELFQRAPFAVVDRGLQIIKSAGLSKDISEREGKVNNVTNNIQSQQNLIIHNEAAKNLAEAIRLSDEANTINLGQLKAG